MLRLKLLCFYTMLASSVFAQHYDIDTEGGVIHLESYGDGDPLLIINGGPGMSSEGFRTLASTLGKKQRAIIFDQRGTGQSDISSVSRSSITMDKMIEDIERIREYLNIEAWAVMGHSFGGMLASYYATKHPERISGLILSSSGGINMDLFNGLSLTSRLSQQNRDSLSYWTGKISRGDTSYHARLQRGKFLAPAYLYDQQYVPIIAERLTQGNVTINGLVFQDMRAMAFDCSSELKTFENPVLIIQGKQDIIPEKISVYAHNIFPNSTLNILDQCGHYGWLETPTEYFGAIESFLGKING